MCLAEGDSQKKMVAMEIVWVFSNSTECNLFFDKSCAVLNLSPQNEKKPQTKTKLI